MILELLYFFFLRKVGKGSRTLNVSREWMIDVLKDDTNSSVGIGFHSSSFILARSGKKLYKKFSIVYFYFYFPLWFSFLTGQDELGCTSIGVDGVAVLPIRVIISITRQCSDAWMLHAHLTLQRQRGAGCLNEGIVSPQ